MGCCITKHSSVNNVSTIMKRLRSTGLPAENSIQPISYNKLSYLKQHVGKVTDIYEKLTKIGAGGFGVVYKAIEKSTKIPRALKLIPKNQVKADTIIAEVQHLRELVISSQDHPNIIKIFGIIEEEDNYVISTELCSGPNLFEKLQELVKFTELDAARYMRQLFSALAHCHQARIVHRDIKPDNLLFEDSSAGSLLKLIDFGISRKQTFSNKLSEAIGTAYFIAPEVLDKEYNDKCDMWSCGIILYVMLSGDFPFKGKDTSRILSNVKQGRFSMEGPFWRTVSSEAKDLLGKLLVKESSMRISAKEVLDHLWIQQKSIFLARTIKLRPSLFMRLKKVRILDSFQQLVLNYVITHLVDPEDLAETRQMYIKLDSGSRGKMTKEDLLEAYENASITPPTIPHLIELCKGQGQCIEFTEFAVATFDWGSIRLDEALCTVFEEFSVNGAITEKGATETLQSINYSEPEIKEVLKHIGNFPLTVDAFLNIMPHTM